MAIECPGCYGIVFRKSGKAALSIERISGWPGQLPLNEDEHLIGFGVAMNYPDLTSQVRELEAEGCVRGVDFVCTMSSEGVLDKPAPTWLVMELAPTGNPPELEAKMDPEVRAMWEAQRKKVFRLAPS